MTAPEGGLSLSAFVARVVCDVIFCCRSQRFHPRGHPAGVLHDLFGKLSRIAFLHFLRVAGVARFACLRQCSGNLLFTDPLKETFSGRLPPLRQVKAQRRLQRIEIAGLAAPIDAVLKAAHRCGAAESL